MNAGSILSSYASLIHFATIYFVLKSVCTSPQCVLTAASIMNDMNLQVDPCDDFSAYACGGFWEREEIPADQDSIGYFRIVRDQNNQVIRSIASGENDKASSGSESAQRNMQKLKDLYISCMDEEGIVNVGRRPVVEQVQKVLDIFPVSDSVLIPEDAMRPLSGSSSKTDKTALSMVLAHLNKLGLHSFGSFGVSTDSKNPKRRVLELTEGGLGLPSKEYYLDDRILGIYETTVGKMFNLIMGDEAIMTTTPEAKVPNATLPTKWSMIAKDIVDFEKKLAAASTDVNDLRDSEKTYNPRTLEQISSMTPSIDWSLALRNTLPAGADILNPTIIVTSPPFQEKLESLLQMTYPETLQYHFVWAVIRQLAGHLARPYFQPLRELDAALTGVSADVVPDRWKHCVLVINQQLGDMAGYYFVQESFRGNSRDQVYDMIETLRETYLKAFPKLEWLDDPTTTGAVKKMNAIVQLIGFSTDSPNVTSSDSLEEYFSEYKVHPEDYFGNQMRENQWSTKKSFRELDKSVNMLKMHMVPQTVNAYYSPTQNQIVFPAGILQPPFFHTENPEYINYGGIGVVAGHEITHGFDNRGHLFDFEGRMHNWWTNATSKAFNTKTRCFVEQYGNFSIKGSDGMTYHVNGQLTLGENIADNGGLKQAFEAWKARSNDDKNGKKFKNHQLPGLNNFTPEQLFFISYARPWCSKQRPESVIRQMRTDPHTLAKYRINGAVQNSVAFARAFKCVVGAPMNPEKKCDLW
ncbi:hypothetical protein BGZ65_001758 [Modicella reniformis]|uniref:Endothelin-converting enzyme 1 n=1 Tax=Modicella reniformis TaxID=1440133 RepID=A0A9P6SVT6_9FUNG|nr:hypothetical protein BGZ65_001758 [Modicella reniformis]